MQAFSKKLLAIGPAGQLGIDFRPARIGFGPWLVVLLTWFSSPALADSSGASANAQQFATLKSQMNAAILRVQQIVNQPVTELRRTPDMEVATFGPGGWFHPGATKPNFLLVDVRASQEFPYGKFEYVTSDLNPGVVFLGSELEFNSMTKYFYTNRSVPKRRLTESEMLEINQLYRVIGRCEHLLFDLENPIPKPSLDASQGPDEPQTPQPLLATFHRWIFTHKPIAIGIVAALLVLLMLLRKLAGRST
ncbi:MAG: hypothetical protein WBS33_00375 [Verrucomicrobiia bacterium]